MLVNLKPSSVDKSQSEIDYACFVNRRRQWHPTPVLLPGKSHGWRSLVGCSPRGRWESDTTERLHFHFSLACIGEGNGTPLQCSCLENPRDGGAWWAAVYGVAECWTRLKLLSSSSSSFVNCQSTKNVFLLQWTCILITFALERVAAWWGRFRMVGVVSVEGGDGSQEVITAIVLVDAHCLRPPDRVLV